MVVSRAVASNGHLINSFSSMKTSKTIGLSRFQARIIARNKRYDDSSPAQKRVMIAKECKRLIEVGVIDATRGNYLTTRNMNSSTPKDARTAINQGLVECSVCAKGAIFIAACSIQNQLKVSEIGGDSKMTCLINNGRSGIDRFGLVALFGPEATRNIEYYFENMSYGHTSYDALLAIMDNIIENEGNFTLKE